VADILEALEGPLALMECSEGPGHCEQESSCAVREPWQRINLAVQSALRGMTLAELAGAPAPLLGIQNERAQSRAARS
jgi:DNA-binding IscR family transcriptional regulator